jgi:hypothetical protein
LVTFIVKVASVIVLQLSTLKYSTSPADMVVVHPVNVELLPLLLAEIVGLAEPVIVSATVGGKLA